MTYWPGGGLMLCRRDISKPASQQSPLSSACDQVISRLGSLVDVRSLRETIIACAAYLGLIGLPETIDVVSRRSSSSLSATP
jgi:hypothetical protein